MTAETYNRLAGGETQVGVVVPGQPLFPAFLALAGRSVVLVGGGSVALTKLTGLQAAGAVVTVVAPLIHPGLRAPGVTIVQREFRSSDLDGSWFVVAAAPPAVNQQVVAVAEERRIFVNAVDDRSAATAYLGGVVRRGDVTVAISTGGAAPALAGLLREGLDCLLPPDLDVWVRTASEQRPIWKQEAVPMGDRRPRLLRALNELYEARPPAGTPGAGG